MACSLIASKTFENEENHKVTMLLLSSITSPWIVCVHLKLPKIEQCKTKNSKKPSD